MRYCLCWLDTLESLDDLGLTQPLTHSTVHTYRTLYSHQFSDSTPLVHNSASTDAFLKEGFEQFADQVENLGKTIQDQAADVVDDGKVQDLIAITTRDWEARLLSLQDEYAAQLQDLEDRLGKEQYARTAERQASSAQIAALKDSQTNNKNKVIDVNQALLAEQVRIENTKNQLEREVKNLQSEKSALQSELAATNGLVLDLQTQLQDYDEERGNVWKLMRRSGSVIRTAFTNRSVAAWRKVTRSTRKAVQAINPASENDTDGAFLKSGGDGAVGGQDGASGDAAETPAFMGLIRSGDKADKMKMDGPSVRDMIEKSQKEDTDTDETDLE